MAQGQSDRPTVLQARLTDEDLEQSYQEWAKEFETDSEAVREALRHSIDEYPPDEEGQQAGQQVVAAAATAVLVVAVGQTALSAGPWPAAGLTALALGAAAAGTQLPTRWLA